MTEKFSSETSWRIEGNVTMCFSRWKKKSLCRIPYPEKISFENEGGNQDILRWKKTKRISHQQTYPKRRAKVSSLYRKEMMKEGNLEQQKGRKNMVRENMSLTIQYDCLFSLEFSKLCLMVEAKILMLMWF